MSHTFRSYIYIATKQNKIISFCDKSVLALILTIGNVKVSV